MKPSTHKIEGINRPKTMRFYPFVFTGKEKDEETGYGYFGARYMDHELMTMWLSVDPMADKYPSLSPYNYCAWNPIRLTDPDGDTIKINDFVYKAGMSSEKLNGFSKTAVDALNNIYNNGGDEGAELINTLCNSKHTFNIKQRLKKVSAFEPKVRRAAYARSDANLSGNWKNFEEHGWTEGSGGDVMWNSDGYKIFTTEGIRINPTYQLLHELCHAYDANFGMLDAREYKFFSEDKGMSLSDWSACMKANCIGSYMGYPMQTIYSGSTNSSGKYKDGTGTRLFEETGIPINPF